MLFFNFKTFHIIIVKLLCLSKAGYVSAACRKLHIKHCDIIYVESIARVQTLSLSGTCQAQTSNHSLIAHSNNRDQAARMVFGHAHIHQINAPCCQDLLRLLVAFGCQCGSACHNVPVVLLAITVCFYVQMLMVVTNIVVSIL
jgi:hypothetical protein